MDTDRQKLPNKSGFFESKSDSCTVPSAKGMATD
jgi:hypothetical protein